ncbi:MAG: hypothetical protein ACPGLV_06455 [Bacteroidia bacterium]
MTLNKSISRFSKSLFYSSIILSISFLMNACGGACAGFDCVNGDCVQGACECDDGYEGTTCNTTWAAKFIGSYEGTDCYDSGLITYSIIKTNRADSIIFDNQYYALITDGESLVFPEQDAKADGVDFIFSGLGNITTKGVDLTLVSKYPDFDTRCELSLERVK